jgi:hypothetical protein
MPKKKPYDLNISFFNETDLGRLSVSMRKGSNSKKEEGVVMQIMLSSLNNLHTPSDIMSWLDSGHGLTSSIFKEITKGQLYDSFIK